MTILLIKINYHSQKILKQKKILQLIPKILFGFITQTKTNIQKLNMICSIF